jgi:hypothetical protein
MDGVWGGLTGRERARVVRDGGTSPLVDPHRVSEVAAMTRQGLTARDIGERLGMHPHVVQRYRKRAREDAARSEALEFYDRPCREYHNAVTGGGGDA